MERVFSHIKTLGQTGPSHGLITSSNAAAAALQSESLRNNPTFVPAAAQRDKLIRYDVEFSVRNILLRDRITSTLVELHESQ